MRTKTLDTLGLNSPHPILKVAAKMSNMKRGELLEVWGDSPTFEKDLRAWCERLGKDILSVKILNKSKKRIRIQL